MVSVKGRHGSGAGSAVSRGRLSWVRCSRVGSACPGIQRRSDFSKPPAEIANGIVVSCRNGGGTAGCLRAAGAQGRRSEEGWRRGQSAAVPRAESLPGLPGAAAGPGQGCPSQPCPWEARPCHRAEEKSRGAAAFRRTAPGVARFGPASRPGDGHPGSPCRGAEAAAPGSCSRLGVAGGDGGEPWRRRASEGPGQSRPSGLSAALSLCRH